MVDTVSTSAMSTYFTNLVNSLMDIERQPLTRLQDKRSTLNVTRGVYSDTSRGLSDLQDTVRALMSSQAGFALKPGRNVTVSNVASGSTVLSATVSNSAITGTYQIDNIVLAKEHRVRSNQQSSSDQALNLSGTILLGGQAARSVTPGTNSISSTVSSFGTADLAEYQHELGSGPYTVETRLYNGIYQFRLADQDGNAINIQNGNQGTYTNSWQDIPTGTDPYDTGRGITIQFGSDPGQFQAGSAQLDYVAQGVEVTIDATDSLNAIATKINNANYPTGQGISATVVDRQLVLSATTPGTRHLIQALDVGTDQVLHTLGVLDSNNQFANVLQNADTDTTFTVNGQPVTRYQNTGISDVISGITLNFAPDAVGKSATVTVDPNWTNARAAIDSFVSKFNEIQSYLTSKTAITKNQNGDKVTFTRGALADDQMLKELRGDMFGAFYSEATGGSYRYMNDIGISIDDSLQVTITDSEKLENALNMNPEGVQTLMDQVMGRLDTILTRFTGGNNSDGYMTNMLSSIDNQVKDLGDDITSLTERLNDRQTSLTNQYAEIQAQLLMLSYNQQTWQSIYSTTSTYG